MAGGLTNKTTGGFAAVALLVLLCATPVSVAHGAEPKSRNPFSMLNSASKRKKIVQNLPLNRLTPQARERILAICNSPTIYRRLPTQAIECDRDMFLFLTRKPETLVGIWDLMGITRVKSTRLGPYKLEAEDGAGTNCKVDLIYGDSNIHIFIADGMYEGSMAPKPIRGSGVFVLRSSYAKSASGGTTVTGAIDCFVQFDSLGADLVARTLSGVIGRSADNNFVETARFIGQVSQASATNPRAMMDVASRLPQVDAATKQQFTDTIAAIAKRSQAHTANPSVSQRTAPQQPATQRTAARRLPKRTK